MLRLRQKLKLWFLFFQNFVEKPWYEVALAFLAALDALIVIIPLDGLVISSTLLVSRKWWRLGVLTAIGSTLGGLFFAFLVNQFGWGFLNEFFPQMATSALWSQLEEIFHQYGLWMLLLVAMAPLVQQPAIALAVLGHHSLAQIGAVMLVGRLFKYLLITSVSRFAPGKIRKLWGVKGELKEVAPD